MGGRDTIPYLFLRGVDTGTRTSHVLSKHGPPVAGPAWATATETQNKPQLHDVCRVAVKGGGARQAARMVPGQRRAGQAKRGRAGMC